VPPCNYTGKGMIIPVFGCGSFGTTTTAMSIALKLATDAKVLYIDFDMVMPKADAWFKVNPIVKNVPDFDQFGSSKFTGLGLFIDRGVQFFLSYTASIVNKPIPTKGGCVDYISGFYKRPDKIKLISADYTSFFNYCGNNYTYIVVDFGKLGCSELNDIIIKMVSDIAYRNVVVTTNDKFEIRTFSMKMDEAHISKDNVAWLLNMCENTKIEDTSKKLISPANYSMMPFNPDLYGKKVDFTKDKLTRDKLDLFMNTIFRK
jgi:MinD-like ATPase involved in chromosome partitioning or flagellar assembly